MRKKSKNSKKKLEPVDGLGPKDIERLRSAIRQVWSWSRPRQLCVARATMADGFPRCEKCKQKVPKVYPDHIEPCGDLDEGYIRRMFVPSAKLQALCRKCHNEKTKHEREFNRAIAKNR